MTTPSTQVSRLSEKQSTSRGELDELLDSTPLATVALVRASHPVIFPTGFARVDDELVIHGSTGSPWLRALADGASAAVAVTGLDGIVVARSGFESHSAIAVPCCSGYSSRCRTPTRRAISID